MSGSIVPSSPTGIELAHEGNSAAVQSWGPPAAPPAPPQGAVNLGRYFAALKRYKWLIVVTLLLGTIGAVAATRIIKPSYSVDTTIVVSESPDPKGPVQAGAMLREQAWRELLQSFAILDPVARQTGSFLTPKNEADSTMFRGFEPTSDLQPGNYILRVNPSTKKYDLAVIRSRKEVIVENGTVGDSIGRTVGFSWSPDPQLLATRSGDVKFEVRTPREAAAELRANMNISMPPETKFIKVTLKGKRSQEVANTMNSILRQFISQAAALKR